MVVLFLPRRLPVNEQTEVWLADVCLVQSSSSSTQTEINPSVVASNVVKSRNFRLWKYFVRFDESFYDDVIGYTRPTISHEPPITRIGSFNAQLVGNKYAAICDRIATEKLHLCAIVETWHDSANSPQLIACAPPGVQFRWKSPPSRRVWPSEAATLRVNHGGICLFHVATLTAQEVPLPVYKSFEVLGSEHSWCAT